MQPENTHLSREVAAALAWHYDEIVGTYIDVFFDDLTDAPWIDRFLSYLPSGSSVLDAGCGPGNFAKYMALRGVQVTGIDISRGMIEAAQRLVPGAQFRLMNLTHIGLPANTFHGVLAAYSFLHIPGDRAKSALLEFRRVLKPGGTLCLMVKEGQEAGLFDSRLVPGKKCFLQLWDPNKLGFLLVIFQPIFNKNLQLI